MARPDPTADRRRFEALFRAHHGAVLRFVLRRTDSAGADDAVAEVFAIAWRRLDAVPEDAPLPWLYAVAGKVLANQRRAAARAARKTRRAAAERPARPGRDPAEQLAERDLVLRAFSTLSEADREALRLVAWEGLPLADAARAAGIARPAFAKRVHRARRRLAARIEELETPELPLRPLEGRA
jgi:RNA polymerase sigma factor (sigma-70 family)